MVEEQIIVALELGSSKLTGVAGKHQTDGSWRIEAVAQEPASGFMRNGVVFNRDKCVAAIKRVVNSLETQLNHHITQVYVGAGGQGLHTEKNTVERSFDGNVAVPLETVNEMMNENLNTPLSGKEILRAIPQEYRVGSTTLIDPVGVLTDHIEGTYCNIVARPLLRTYIRDSFKEAGIAIADLKCTPLLLGQELLSDDEKRSGCVLVDFGADTTTVLVYKGGLLRFMSVIPLGSANITKDIMSLQIEEREAERLKVDYGYMGDDIGEEEKLAVAVTLGDGETITKGTLINVIEARLEEILLNVKEQIVQSGYPSSILSSGAFLVGDGAQLKNMVRAFKQFVEINKVSILRTLRTTVHFAKGLGKQYANDNRLALVGVLSVIASGTASCTGSELPEQGANGLFDTPDTPGTAEVVVEVPPTKEEKPEEEKKEEKKKKGNVFGRIARWLTQATEKIVGDDEDRDNAQREERDNN